MTSQVQVSTEQALDREHPLSRYMLDCSNPKNTKALSGAIKNSRAEKAAKFSDPLLKVRGTVEEMSKVLKRGKNTAEKGWKRMITKPKNFRPGIRRLPVIYELFIRSVLTKLCLFRRMSHCSYKPYPETRSQNVNFQTFQASSNERLAYKLP